MPLRSVWYPAHQWCLAHNATLTTANSSPNQQKSQDWSTRKSRLAICRYTKWKQTSRQDDRRNLTNQISPQLPLQRSYRKTTALQTSAKIFGFMKKKDWFDENDGLVQELRKKSVSQSLWSSAWVVNQPCMANPVYSPDGWLGASTDPSPIFNSTGLNTFRPFSVQTKLSTKMQASTSSSSQSEWNQMSPQPRRAERKQGLMACHQGYGSMGVLSYMLTSMSPRCILGTGQAVILTLYQNKGAKSDCSNDPEGVEKSPGFPQQEKFMPKVIFQKNQWGFRASSHGFCNLCHYRLGHDKTEEQVAQDLLIASKKKT